MVDADKARQRFSELLPLYVNGTLNAQDHAWVTAYLASHPDAGQELQFMHLLYDTTRSTQSPVPEAQRLNRLLSAWQPTRPASSRLQKALAWLQGRVPMPVPAMALASVVILGQAAVIGALMLGGSEDERYRSERLDCAPVPSLRVVFNPDARHLEILLLLRSVEATVQNGPSETGELWLTVPRSRSLDAARAMLRSSVLVDEVVVNERLRPAECAP